MTMNKEQAGLWKEVSQKENGEQMKPQTAKSPAFAWSVKMEKACHIRSVLHIHPDIHRLSGASSSLHDSTKHKQMVLC